MTADAVSPDAGRVDAPGVDKAEAEPEVLVEVRGRLGLLTLNRPKAINALTHGMVRTIAEALDHWEADPGVHTVAIVGAGDRGLCAGGDVVSLHRDATTGDGSGAAGFWRDEYRLNARIARYPKPFVAVQDGLVLGGGIGVSAHGSHRIVTERSKLGFPEVSIGFVPDVGATWLLSRAPGQLGTRIALTGANVRAADAIELGFADVYVPSDRIPPLLRALEKEDAGSVVSSFAEDPGAAPLAADRDWADPAFAAGSVPAVIAALRAVGTDEADVLADTIDAKSPIALAVTLESLRRAESLNSLEQALDQEFRVSTHAATAHDFAEGIRAQLIDKDRNPRWLPASHAEVGSAEVEAFFTGSTWGELGLSDGDTDRAHTPGARTAGHSTAEFTSKETV